MRLLLRNTNTSLLNAALRCSYCHMICFGLLLCTSVSHADPIAHFKFDGDATDSTGNAVGTVATHGAPTFIAGIDGQAASFDGSDDYFSISAPTDTPVLGVLDSFTISIWLKTDQNNNQVPRIMAVFNGGENDFEDGNFVIGSDQLPLADVTNVGMEANDMFDGNEFGVDGVVDDTRWYHVVFVVDQSDATASNNSTKIYIDGNEEASISHAAIVSFADNDTVYFGAGATPTSTGDPSRFYDGGLDDVQVYNKVLSESQIEYLFANPGSSIPEPTSFLIIALGLTAIVSQRRRSKG